MVFKIFPNLKLIKNLKLKISNFRGITLIEVVVVIFIISLFSMILISDFPKIQRQFALSRVAYKLAQDLRKTQDLALSGVIIKDQNGSSIAIKGYGIYVNLMQSTTQYLIYADVTPGDRKYIGNFSTSLCSQSVAQTSDCPIEIIDVSKENSDLYIKDIKNVIGNNGYGVNFSPPNPKIDINTLSLGKSEIGIVLGLRSDSSAIRTVWTNTSGLINVQ